MRTLGYAAALAAALGGLARPAVAQSPSPGDTLRANRDLLYDALQVRPALRGAWVAIEPADGVFRVKATVDSDNADAQFAAVQELLAELYAPGTYAIEPPVRLPITRLIADLQDAVQVEDDLRGSQVNFITYDLPLKPDRTRAEPDAGARVLKIWARVPPAEDAVLRGYKKKIESLAENLLKKTPWADLKARVNVDVQAELAQVQPSAHAANILLHDGIAAYGAGRFADANRRFADALVEDPGNPLFLYWRALAALGAGDSERAYRLVRPLVVEQRGQAIVGTFGGLGSQFERVQGERREQMHALERRALLEMPTPRQLSKPAAR